MTGTYSQEIRKAVLGRVTGANKESVRKVAKELNINKATIYNWIHEAELEGNEQDHKRSSLLTSQDKFHMVLKSAALSEQELGEYCRRKGIYAEDLGRWKAQCVASIGSSKEDTRKLKSELKEEKEKNRKIERELKIKEKALAEAAALLVLRKNVQAIWGDQEEE